MIEASIIIVSLLYLYLLVATVYLLLDNRESTTTIAWILVFIFLPIAGLIIYILAGRNWRKKKKNERLGYKLIHGPLKQVLRPLKLQHHQLLERHRQQWKSPKYKKELIQLLYQSSGSLLTSPNRVSLYFSGKSKFEQLMKDLENAHHYIYIECFIWRTDSMTMQLKDLLIRKAGQGVAIKLLIDSFGSLFLSNRYIRDLRRAGIEIYKYYNFLSLFKFHTINYRNHRKIIVIDGKIGYTGGMNIGQEYIDGGRRFASWRDTHMRFLGRAVTSLEIAFAVDWFNTTYQDIIGKLRLNQIGTSKHDLPVQITTSGPDSRWPSIMQLFFCLITSAEKSIFIQTPYFIPDPGIYTALKTAGLRGLEVRLMVTGVPDKKLPYWSAYTYFEELLAAGIKVYHYQKGFMHAKSITIDSEICAIGTANMDMRSFSLNYELTTVIYDKTTTDKVEKQFFKDLKYCRELTELAYQSISTPKRLGHSLARLVAPLL